MSRKVIYVPPRYRRKGLGGGARGLKRARAMGLFDPQPIRRFVPRTRGPFSKSESKYFDAEVDDFAVPANGAWAATNDVFKGTIAIPQEGSDIDNRVGRKISVYKVALRGIIRPNVVSDQADVLTEPSFRLIFWMDTQTNATVTTSASLMAAPANAEADNVFCTFQNTANFGRFRVLKDMIIYPRTSTAGTDGANTLSVGMSSIPFKITHKFRKLLNIKFNGTNGGTIGDIVDNSLYLSIQASNSSFAPSITCLSRVYYKDM